MTKTNQAAEKGEQFLLNNHKKYELEVEYDFDGERIFIQLTDKDSGTCTVFSGRFTSSSAGRRRSTTSSH